MIADDRRYTKTHEWVLLTGDSTRVGISDHAQDSLGDITFVELPAVGTTITAGKECGVIESVKAASDLFSPVSGTVTEVNSTLESEPEKINSDPHGEGWLFKVSGVSQEEYNKLMDGAAYGSFLESEQ
jgi:glycine cleavage system H protein